MLGSGLRVVLVPRTFQPEILTKGDVSDDTVSRERGKSDF